jgi:hypothetical protein
VTSQGELEPRDGEADDESALGDLPEEVELRLRRSTLHMGPIPDADLLAKYEDVLPGLAGRIRRERYQLYRLREQPRPVAGAAAAGAAGVVGVARGDGSLDAPCVREMAGLHHSCLADALIMPSMGIAFALGHASHRIELLALGVLSPNTVPVVVPVLLGIPPKRRETLTPEQAREHYA